MEEASAIILTQHPGDREDGFASAHQEPHRRPLVRHPTSQPHRIAQTLFRPVVDLHPTATRSRPYDIVVDRHEDPTSGGVVFAYDDPGAIPVLRSAQGTSLRRRPTGLEGHEGQRSDTMRE